MEAILQPFLKYKCEVQHPGQGKDGEDARYPDKSAVEVLTMCPWEPFAT